MIKCRIALYFGGSKGLSEAVKCHPSTEAIALVGTDSAGHTEKQRNLCQKHLEKHLANPDYKWWIVKWYNKYTCRRNDG